MRRSTELLGAPARCVHVGDRESDIYELFCLAQELGTHFLVRTCVDRLALGGDTTVDAVMDEVAVQGVHAVDIRDGQGHVSTATVELTYRSLRVLPPVGKQKRYPALTLTVLHAREREEPADRPRIDWKLLTDLPVLSPEAAIEKLRWYAVRWKIEVFHKILKSGCKVEEARLRSADRLVKLIAVYCLVSWRMFWMTMINRSAPDVEAGIVFTDREQQVLDFLVPNKSPCLPGCNTLGIYFTKVAKLGGYLARGCDPPPGNMVMWRGMARLIDIALGSEIAPQLVGK